MRPYPFAALPFAALPFAALLVLVACSESSPGTLADNVLSADALTGTGDVTSDVTPGSGADTSASTPDTSGNTPGPTAPTFCAENADCASGHCIESECAETCVDSCATNYACKGVASTGADIAFVCVPRFPKLCRPCVTHDDCRGQVEVGVDRCVPFGPEGRFCGGDCAASECPSGYRCDDVDGAKQCVPESGQCTCRPQWVAEQASTVCTASNELGSCSGARTCTPQGLSSCDAPTATPEQCDGEDDDCNGLTDDGIAPTACEAINSFGTCPGERTCSAGSLVCSAPAPAADVCDGVDNDCDGVTDLGFPDSDGDGKADCLEIDADDDGVPNAQDDCPTVYDPDQADLDNDGAGDACDKDDDGDTWVDSQDCEPLEPSVYPGATEICDGADQSCEGLVDEGFPDLDGDGAADCVDDDDDGDTVLDVVDNCPVTANPGQNDTDGDGIGDACEDDLDGDLDPDVTDCQKLDPAIHHGAVEQCNDVDDNCNGIVDEGYPDPDQDGLASCLDPDDDDDGVLDVDDNCPVKANPGQADLDGDLLGDVCDDDDDGDGSYDDADCAPKDAAVHPLAQEVCNGRDDDCDAAIDEENATGCQVFYLNEDGDGFGNAAVSRCLCAGVSPFTAPTAGDCDDKNAQVFPDATEACNGKDDNCDGIVDGVGSFGCSNAFSDGDNDGYGAGPSVCACPGAGGYVPTGGDCNDSSPSIKPGQLEVCNGLDDDCDSQTDEEGAFGCQQTYLDKDHDGYGVSGQSKCLCAPSGDYTATEGGDCDDNDGQRSPGLAEVCDGKDNGCNGQVDEGVKLTFYLDNDGDHYGAAYNTKEACTEPAGYTTQGGDCNDFNGAIAPNKPELCNLIDDDCDGQTDEGLPLVTVYVDLDGDSFGAKGTPGTKSCLFDNDGNGTPEAPPKGYALVATDCNDSAATVYPGAAELCDGQLNNCSGKVADFQCPTVCPGQWPVPAGATVGYPAIAQLDGTNNYEVVVMGTGPIQVLDSEGVPKWTAAAAINYSYPTLADVNLDGNLDVVAFENNQIRVFSGSTGAVLETYSGTNVRITGARQGVAFDLDDDGNVDFVGGTNDFLTIVLRNGSGGAKTIHTIAPPSGATFPADVPMVADLDGDGIAEVIVGTGYFTCNNPGQPACKGQLLVVDPVTGTLKNDPTTTFVVPEPTLTYAGGPVPMYVDVDHDGFEDVYHSFGHQTKPALSLAWSQLGMPVTPTISGGSPRIAPIGTNGTLNPNGALATVGGAVVDLDEDGVYEVIAGGSSFRVLRAGKVMDGYPIATATEAPVIGDINRDGRLDVLFVGSESGELNCYSLGQGTAKAAQILTNGHTDGIGGANLRTGSFDPLEPNDRRATPFVGGPGTTASQARGVRIRGFADQFTSSSGTIRQLRGLIGSKGDRDFYRATGPRIRAQITRLVGTVDYDLRLHVYNSAGTTPLGIYEDLGTGASALLDCDWNNPCPELGSGSKEWLIEVRGKNEAVDYGPWPYQLTVYGAQ